MQNKYVILGWVSFTEARPGATKLKYSQNENFYSVENKSSFLRSKTFFFQIWERSHLSKKNFTDVQMYVALWNSPVWKTKKN